MDYRPIFIALLFPCVATSCGVAHERLELGTEHRAPAIGDDFERDLPTPPAESVEDQESGSGEDPPPIDDPTGGDEPDVASEPYAPLTPARTWTAPFADGWFPTLSPDGAYVACGSGNHTIVELATGEVHVIEAGSAYAASWIRPGVATYLSYAEPVPRRMEVDVATMVAVPTADDAALAMGNLFVARDGHWASYLAGHPPRIAYDNQLVAVETGGALSLGDDGWLAFASTQENQALEVWHGTTFITEYTARTPLLGAAIGAGGYVLYGGYGPVHGIYPDGTDVDLTIAPGRFEGPARVFEVDGEPWVATTAWDFAAETGYVLLRPFGSRAAVVLSAAAVALDVVVAGDVFVIAYNDDRGRLTVVEVPVDARLQEIPQ